MAITLSIDTSELRGDIERIEAEELGLPTVSSVLVKFDGVQEEEIVVWLSSE